jgi:hypothetical protein
MTAREHKRPIVMQRAFGQRIQPNWGTFVQILRSNVTASTARSERQDMIAPSFVVAVVTE